MRRFGHPLLNAPHVQGCLARLHLWHARLSYPSALITWWTTRRGVCNTLTGTCACSGLWTGPTCERAISDFSIPSTSASWYQPSLGVTWEWQIDGKCLGNGFVNEVPFLVPCLLAYQPMNYTICSP